MSDTVSNDERDEAAIVDDGPGDSPIPLELDGRQIVPAGHAPRLETVRIPGGGILVGEMDRVGNGAWIGTADTVTVER